MFGAVGRGDAGESGADAEAAEADAERELALLLPR